MLPNIVQQPWHVRGMAGDNDDEIPTRYDDAELSVGSVAAICAVPAAPQLVAVAVVPIAADIQTIDCLLQRLCLSPNDVPGRGRLPGPARRIDPLLRQELTTFPLPPLQIELAEFRHRFRREAQTPATHIDTSGAAFPMLLAN